MDRAGDVPGTWGTEGGPQAVRPTASLLPGGPLGAGGRTPTLRGVREGCPELGRPRPRHLCGAPCVLTAPSRGAGGEDAARAPAAGTWRAGRWHRRLCSSQDPDRPPQSSAWPGSSSCPRHRPPAPGRRWSGRRQVPGDPLSTRGPRLVQRLTSSAAPAGRGRGAGLSRSPLSPGQGVKPPAHWRRKLSGAPTLSTR